jgi:flagellar basal-body rod modification protein FlgD
MDLTSPSQTKPGADTPSPASKATAADKSESTNALSSDFETFLKMLTTQMRNQDPLNPVESADFAVQLATFSNVEQQVRTNDLLGGLGARIDTLGLGQLSGWIGLEAEARVPVTFKGDPVSVTTEVEPRADAAQLVVTDEQGRVVQRQDIAPKSGPLDWTGRDASGVPLPHGRYNIAVQSSAKDEVLAQNAVTVHSRITEARQEAGETAIVLADGQSLSASDIISLRQPSDRP